MKREIRNVFSAHLWRYHATTFMVKTLTLVSRRSQDYDCDINKTRGMLKNVNDRARERRLGKNREKKKEINIRKR